MLTHVRMLFLIAGAAIGLVPARGAAQPVLYGATGSGSIAGHLYILNQTNGSVVSDVGPLLDSSNNTYGITGLAFNAATDTLYGTTSNTSPLPWRAGTARRRSRGVTANSAHRLAWRPTVGAGRRSRQGT